MTDEVQGPPVSRLGIAVIALLGIFVAGYLTMYNFGLLGVIQCGTGGCETVQSSQYAMLFGTPVALLGLFGYIVIFAIAMIGIQPRWVAARWVAVLLVLISGVGTAFSAYLTYLEAAVIHAWCQWCVVSAVLMTLIFVLSLMGLRKENFGSPPI